MAAERFMRRMVGDARWEALPERTRATRRREGVAMGDAAPGGRFMVKVDATRTPVQAIAVEAGRATLPGWSN